MNKALLKSFMKEEKNERCIIYALKLKEIFEERVEKYSNPIGTNEYLAIGYELRYIVERSER